MLQAKLNRPGGEFVLFQDYTETSENHLQ